VSRRDTGEPAGARARAEQLRTDIVTTLMAAGPKTAPELLEQLPRGGTSLVYEDVYRSLRVLEKRNDVTRTRSGEGRSIRWKLTSKVKRTTP
jgi:Fe2+ or Zn2+ uptake regulation protein